MEPLKNQFFNQATFEKLTYTLSKHTTGLNQQKMLSDLMHHLEEYELKERLRNTTQVIKKHLNSTYKEQIMILKQVAPTFKGSFFGMVFPDFVELYGQKDLETSYHALEHFTQYSSSEFAIRPFFKLDFMQTLDKMKSWSKNENFHVRRLSSEGSRPRLPWSFQLKEVIENPALTLPILKNLKKDEEIYVKKSVANHLNDFSKDNPQFLTKELTNWDQRNLHTQWIVKHALRTLIKKGDEEALSIIGVSKNVNITLKNFKLNTSSIQLGDSLIIEMEILSKSHEPQNIVIDYAIEYKKSNGSLSPKVFKLKTCQLPAKSSLVLTKKHQFKDFSTRKHYTGEHWISILINGNEQNRTSFQLNC